MSRRLSILFVALAIAGTSHEALAQLAHPRPEMFVRPEDQQRARQLQVPCTEADEGAGCYRYDGRLIREFPCVIYIKADVLSTLPTDQCYAMDPPRQYRGVWIDQFEGQHFVPEGARQPEWPRGNPRSPEWRKQLEEAIAATIWLDVGRTELVRESRGNGRRFFIEFVGRKTSYPGNYGHLGGSGQEIIVDRVISFRECPQTGVCSQ